MARKCKQDALATRNQLLDAAEQVFYAKGYSLTTLMDVATAAGMTRGAIYWHFKNKEDLFEAMIERFHLPLESLADACADDNVVDPLGMFRQFSIDLLKQVATNPREQQVFSVLLHKFEYNGQVSHLEARQRKAHNDFTKRIERILKKAVQLGQLPADLDVRKATQTKQAYFIGILNNWLFDQSSFDLENEAESLVDNYFYMLKLSPYLRTTQTPQSN